MRSIARVPPHFVWSANAGMILRRLGHAGDAAAAVLASYLPARRAAAVDPVETMRAE